MGKLRFSWFQLTFGQEEAYSHPEVTYARLKKHGYDAIELTPPKGRYGRGVSPETYAAVHRQLSADHGVSVSCVNECWGEAWDPFSPTFKTLTDEKTAALAVAETRASIDFAREVGAPCVTVAVAVHGNITPVNVQECTAIAVGALRKMCEYASPRGVKLVFEVTNHLEMGTYVNTVANHRRLIELTGAPNLGIQVDWFHAHMEELNPYEVVMDAQPLLWHMHFRDSNSLTPGYGTIDFKSVIRAVKKTDYRGYCTIESAPMVPDADTACRDGIEYLRLLERIVDYQLSPEYPNGYRVRTGDTPAGEGQAHMLRHASNGEGER